MSRAVLTAAEARAHAEGTLTEIRRAVDSPPRFWSFMDGLDGVTYPTGYKQIRPSHKGLFIWSVDPRDPQPARPASLGQPGTVLDVAEEYAIEDCGDDGDRLIWRADRAAVWVDSGVILDKVFYLDADYQPSCGWQSADTMPAWAVRSRVRITAVRVERAATGWEWVYSVEKAS